MIYDKTSAPKNIIPKGARLHQFKKADGGTHQVTVISLRDPRHLNLVLEKYKNDQPIAFHGWGVEGAGKRVDKNSQFWGHWELKPGRAPGSKIPLMEPPEYAVKHIDWQQVHPDFRYLQNPKEFKKLWKSKRPFHVIAPYNIKSNLTQAVVTPAFDPVVAPNTPVPTICLFWVEDPALIELMKRSKAINPTFQIGVSSLNEAHKMPTFLTKDLLGYLQTNQILNYDLVVEDPLLESINIASSHSQFALPLIDQAPAMVMKRRGSLSAKEFTRLTGIPVVGEDTAVQAAHGEEDQNLDQKLTQVAKSMTSWNRRRYFHYLKALLPLG